MASVETVWTQCLMEIVRLNRLQGKENIDIKEVDRLAALACQELRIDASTAIQRVVGDTRNGFDEPIPF